MATTEAGNEFRPLHEAHAIDQVVATIQFAQPQPDEAIQAAIAAMDQFQELPASHHLRGLGFQIGPAGVLPVSPVLGGAPDGRSRSITNNSGVTLKELRVDRQTLAYRSQAYTRWDAVWGEALRYFSALLPQLASNVQTFTLQYIDKFVWEGDPAACRAAPLFRANSPYLAPRSLDAEDLWHCHSGQFRRASTHAKRLEVVDIDCVDEMLDGSRSKRVVRISTVLTDFLNQPGFAPTAFNGATAVQEAAQVFPTLHDELKQVFSEIISDEYAARVGLNANAA
jgi:uncharacterized protein (TIGR04255 family)